MVIRAVCLRKHQARAADGDRGGEQDQQWISYYTHIVSPFALVISADVFEIQPKGVARQTGQASSRSIALAWTNADSAPRGMLYRERRAVSPKESHSHPRHGRTVCDKCCCLRIQLPHWEGCQPPRRIVFTIEQFLASAVLAAMNINSSSAIDRRAALIQVKKTSAVFTREARSLCHSICGQMQ